MSMTFIDSRDDLDWLFDVHLKSTTKLFRDGTVCAILVGNEDAPQKIELYRANDIRETPVTFDMGDNDEYVLRRVYCTVELKVGFRTRDNRTWELFGPAFADVEKLRNWQEGRCVNR